MSRNSRGKRRLPLQAARLILGDKMELAGLVIFSDQEASSFC